jgi:hypothetical protein
VQFPTVSIAQQRGGTGILDGFDPRRPGASEAPGVDDAAAHWLVPPGQVGQVQQCWQVAHEYVNSGGPHQLVVSSRFASIRTR